MPKFKCTSIFAICLIISGLNWARAQSHAASETPPSDRQITSFDDGWRFDRGDVKGAESSDFDDSKWRTLSVPHDWMIEGAFDEHSPGGAEAGGLDGGIGWYRKAFTLPTSAAGKRVLVRFDGIYMNSEIWLNGQKIGNHPYGYTSFELDLTPALKFAGPNMLAVRVDVTQPCSRFYSGAGIYRHVWMTVVDPIHIQTWSTFVTSKVNGTSATVTARSTVGNDSEQSASVQLTSSLADANEKSAGDARSEVVTIAAHGTADIVQTFDVQNPSLWSIDAPTLYHLKTVVKNGERSVDSEDTPFGIRTTEFTIDKGFFLNGKHVQIQGVCDHHDLGCLGAAVNRRAIQRQLEILKSFGCNAIRTSHNPPAPELLDLCDEMGFVVMDEAFDEWKLPKRPFGYSRFFDDWSERDLISMVRRDRNHPSVVMWSVGNEIREQSSKDGEEMTRRLVDICKKQDPTRVTTSAMDQMPTSVESGFSKPLDVAGINYHVGFYDYPKLHGKVPMIGSETSSTVSSRGEYGLSLQNGKVATTQRSNHQVTSYDTFYPSWATAVEKVLQTLKSSPWVAGEFVWTGFDYIGEPTPFGWPSRSSYFGIVDLCGFPKDRYYLYQSQWSDKPMVHLLPHWTWNGFEGQTIPVWCYTNADSVELFLNDKSVGTRDWTTTKALHFEWLVPYAPGVLKAVAHKDGKEVASDIIYTAGEPARIVLTADRAKLSAGVRDLSFITAQIVDAEGHVCPNANNVIAYTIEGPATIAGTDNGDATDLDSFQSKSRPTFHGLGLAVVSAEGESGVATLKATSNGLMPAELSISISPEK